MHPITLYAQAIQRTASARYDPRSTACSMERECAPEPMRRSHVRRAMALGLRRPQPGSAAAVRRLDECVADDLGRALSPSE